MDSNLATQLECVMTPEQFNQVVSAILDGKYSWACLLILQFSGYNPLHYIPYRTYNRLIKENRLSQQSKSTQASSQPVSPAVDRLTISSCLSQLEDLGYLETLQNPSETIKGGHKGLSTSPY